MYCAYRVPYTPLVISPPSNPPPPFPGNGHLAQKAQKLLGAEADLPSGTMVQFCGAIPPPLSQGASAHRAHRALRQTRHLPVKCTPFSDRCFVKCYSKMFGSHCNVWFPMLCFQAVSKCLVSTAMFVSQCFVLKRSQNVWFPLQCLFPNALF